MLLPITEILTGIIVKVSNRAMQFPLPEEPVYMYVYVHVCIHTDTNWILNKHIPLKFKAKKEKSIHYEYEKSDFLTKAKTNRKNNDYCSLDRFTYLVYIWIREIVGLPF